MTGSFSYKSGNSFTSLMSNMRFTDAILAFVAFAWAINPSNTGTLGCLASSIFLSNTSIWSAIFSILESPRILLAVTSGFWPLSTGNCSTSPVIGSPIACFTVSSTSRRRMINAVPSFSKRRRSIGPSIGSLTARLITRPFSSSFASSTVLNRTRSAAFTRPTNSSNLLCNTSRTLAASSGDIGTRFLTNDAASICLAKRSTMYAAAFSARSTSMS